MIIDLKTVDIFFQASLISGVGHLMRCSRLIKELEYLNIQIGNIFFNGDEHGRELAKNIGLIISDEFSSNDHEVIIVDCMELSNDVSKYISLYKKRILISPVNNKPEMFNYIAIPNVPNEYKLKASQDTIIITEPSFVFAGIKHININALSFNDINIGICLGGGYLDFEYGNLLEGVAINPAVKSIKIITKKKNVGFNFQTNPKIHIIESANDPWSFFSNVNVFIGGQGVMLAESASRAIPTFSIKLNPQKVVNSSLIQLGSLLEIEIDQLGVFAETFSNPVKLQSMHEKTVQGLHKINPLALSTRISEIIQ